MLKYTQNEKIMQVTDTTLVVGVGIAKNVHFARPLIIVESN